MIRGFKGRKTKQFFEGKHVPAFSGFADQASRRLTVLDNAESLRDLAAMRSNRLETGKDSTVCESIDNGVFAFAGRKMDRMMWKLRIIIN